MAKEARCKKTIPRKLNHHSHLFGHSRVDSYVNVFETTTPFLEFSIEFQSNDLTYHKPYTKKQQILYLLIKYLYDEKSMGYRKISNFLSRLGIKPHRGNTFTNSSIHSILKRKKQRDERMVLRNKEHPIKMSKLELKYLRT